MVKTLEKKQLWYIDFMSKTTKVINEGGATGFVFFVAWIGALVYFVQQSEGFWGFIVAIVQSIFWPAFIVYEVLKLLGV